MMRRHASQAPQLPPARAARALRAEDGLREGVGGRRLVRPRRAGEQVGVAHLVLGHRRAQELAHLRLAEHVLEGVRHRLTPPSAPRGSAPGGGGAHPGARKTPVFALDVGHPGEQVSKLGEHRRRRAGLAPVGPHRAHALRNLSRYVGERRVHARVEALPRLLEPVRPAARGARKPLPGRAARLQKDGAVRADALAGELVGRVHERARKPAAVGLVGHRGIREAVATAPRPRARARALSPPPLSGRARPRRRAAPPRRTSPRCAVQDDGAQPLAYVGAARLAQAHHLPAVRAQRVGQEADVRGLAGALPALERDEDAPGGIGAPPGH